MTPVSVELFAYPWDILDAGEAPFLDHCVELNLGLPVTATFAQAAAQVDYARRHGVRRFSFFNFGLLGESRLRWIQDLACVARKAGA
jgi:hypothetical protein